MSFEKKVQKYIEEQQLIQEGDRLLIACSGGIDSMGLLHFFIQYQKVKTMDIYVAHVDHMLRGEVSYEDRLFVEQFCKEQNIPIFSTSIPIHKMFEKEGGNLQALCRRERYAYLAQVMKENEIDKLVTAHHADDQLESMLMALTRAGSIQSFKGISTKRDFTYGTIIRPFLMVTKSEIREYLGEMGGSYREDLSNEKDDYTRNRFRHHIIPLLIKENEHAAIHAVRLAEDLQQDDDFLFELAKNRFYHVVDYLDDRYVLNVNEFQKEPVPLQRRIILILLNYLYGNFHSQSNIICRKIIELCKSQEGNATIHLPEQFVANRSYGKVAFFKMENTIVKNDSRSIIFGEWNNLKGFRLYIGELSKEIFVEQKEVETYYFNSNDVSLPFNVRNRKEGDRIHLKGMGKPKRLSRLFIDEKIPLLERDTWPILVDSKDNILAVLGVRVNKQFSKSKRIDDNMFMIVQKVVYN